MNSNDANQTSVLFWFMGGAVGCLLMLSVIVFIVFGPEIRTGLNRATARAAFEAGQALAAEGRPEAALQRYRQALEEDSMDEALRHQCLLAMGDLLTEQQRYDEAIDAYAALPPTSFVAAPKSFGFYLHALDREQHFDALAAAAVHCLTAVDSEADADMLTAQFQRVATDREAPDYDAVLSEWGRAHVASPEDMAAVARLRDAIAR